jgi:hypothetical protein
MSLGKISEPNKGLVWLKGPSQIWIKKLFNNPFTFNRKKIKMQITPKLKTSYFP